MEDTTPEQSSGALLRSGPCSDTLDGPTDVPGVLLVVFNSPVAVHGIAPSASHPTKRPARHLAPGASAASSAQNHRHPDLTINRPHSSSPLPGNASLVSRKRPGLTLRDSDSHESERR